MKNTVVAKRILDAAYYDRKYLVKYFEQKTAYYLTLSEGLKDYPEDVVTEGRLIYSPFPGFHTIPFFCKHMIRFSFVSIGIIHS